MMTPERVNEILHHLTVVYAETDDLDKRLGNPFDRLPRGNIHLAETIIGEIAAGHACGHVTLSSSGTMLLLWRRIRDEWRFELSHL